MFLERSWVVGIGREVKVSSCEGRSGSRDYLWLLSLMCGGEPATQGTSEGEKRLSSVHCVHGIVAGYGREGK